MEDLLAFYITFPSKESAEKICSALIEKKLIACSNILPIEAAYWWQGAVQHEQEVLAFVKTVSRLEKNLIEEVERIHPYDTPCIIHWPVKANEKYSKWVSDSVRSA